MIDFIGYVRDTRMEVAIKPATENALCRLVMTDPATGFVESHTVTLTDMARHTNREAYLTNTLNQMGMAITARKNQLYASRLARKNQADKRRELDKFWRNE